MWKSAPLAGARLEKCLDIADQVVDLRTRQRKIWHFTVRMRQERVKLVGRHSAAGNCAESRGTLWEGDGWIATDHVAIGASYPSEFAPSGDVGTGRARIKETSKKNIRKRVEILEDIALPLGHVEWIGSGEARHCRLPARMSRNPAVNRSAARDRSMPSASVRRPGSVGRTICANTRPPHQGELSDDWFDPIEAGLRDRVRELIEAMIEGELETVLSHPCYARHPKADAESTDRQSGITRHRHGHRLQKVLLGLKDMGGETSEA